MLNIPLYSNNRFNIIGIDPGSTMIGVSIITMEIPLLNIINTEAFTINAGKLTDSNNWLSYLYNDRINRIKFIEDKLTDIFNYYDPLCICAESPFFGMKHPAAYGALVEVICAIRSAVIRYDQWKTLEVIDPATVKRGVGGMGNADKAIMKQKVLGIPQLRFIGNAPLEFQDEHSIDAIAVAWWKYNDLLKQLQRGI